MLEENQILSLLQVTVPADTALTVNSEIKILQLLGIVTDPTLEKSLEIASTMLPAATPATLYGLISLLGNLVKQHPKATKAHQDELNTVLSGFASVPDATLTYGSFLPICEVVLKAKADKQHKHHSGSGKN